MIRRWSRSLRFAALAACLFVLGAATALALVRRASAAPVAVRVTMEDFRFVLSRQRVPTGSVRFEVVNRGATLHDFAIGRVKTRLLKPGERQTLVVRVARAARMAYRCTVAGHAALGMKGTLVVGKPKPAPPPTMPPPPPPAPTGLQLTPVGSFDRPDFITSPPGDPTRLFVVETRGVIEVVDDGVVEPTPFLDISDEVQSENETGLLGL